MEHRNNFVKLKTQLTSSGCLSKLKLFKYSMREKKPQPYMVYFLVTPAFLGFIILALSFHFLIFFFNAYLLVKIQNTSSPKA